MSAPCLTHHVAQVADGEGVLDCVPAVDSEPPLREHVDALVLEGLDELSFAAERKGEGGG